MLGCSRLAALSTAIYIAVIIISLSGYGGASVVRERNNKLFQVVPSIAQEDERKCDAGVRDYLAKDKIEAAEPVIPYSTSCILEHLGRGGRALTPPNKSAKVLLKGVPVTGTTWTEIFVKHLLREVCNSGLYGECHATGCDEDNAVMHHIPDNQNSTKKNRRCYIKFKEGKQVNFIPEGKHHPEMSGHVQCHPIKDGEKKRECELLLHDASQARSLSAIPTRWRFQPGWVKECLMSENITYRGLPECLPEYVKLPESRKPIWATIGRLWQQQEPDDDDDDDDDDEEAEEDSISTTKYILTVRDPRDTAVSWASKRNVSNAIDEVQICKRFSVWTAFFYFWHVKQLGSATPTLELWYRSMKDDLRREIEKLLTFLELRASEVIVNKILNKSTFESMKERAENTASTEATRVAKLRKGSYGHFRKEMSAATARKCSEFMRRILPLKHQSVFGIT